MYMYEFGCENDITPRLSISIVSLPSKFTLSSMATTDTERKGGIKGTMY